MIEQSIYADVVETPPHPMVQSEHKFSNLIKRLLGLKDGQYTIILQVNGGRARWRLAELSKMEQ